MPLETNVLIARCKSNLVNLSFRSVGISTI